MSEHPLETVSKTADFLLGGNATITLVSNQEETRYTYRIRSSDNPGMWFISLLSGPDNESDYSYLGLLYSNDGYFALRLTGKSAYREGTEPVGMLRTLLDALNDRKMPAELEVWHEGYCGRCGRKLTVPESIDLGFGPECAEILGL